MFGIPLHILIAHFPIVLAIVAFLYDAWASYSGDRTLHAVGSTLTKYAALAAVIAASTGLGSAGMSGLGSGSTVTAHAGGGILATIVLVALAIMRYSSEVREEESGQAYSGLWLATGALAAVLIAITALAGHRI